MYLACTQTDSYDVAAGTGIGVLSSATFATTILTGHVKRYRERVARATPVGASVNSYWGNNVHAFCGEDNDAARKLAALSLKTFFGPDKPYIRDRVNAYEQLLESWGGVPDHLKADFGRWLRQSDDAHKAQAEQVGISLDSGPGAARAAFGQMDPDTLLRARHHHCRRPGELHPRRASVRGGRSRRGHPDHADGDHPPRAGPALHRDVRQAGDSGVPGRGQRQAHARRRIEGPETCDDPAAVVDRLGVCRRSRGATGLPGRPELPWGAWGARSRPAMKLDPPGADELSRVERLVQARDLHDVAGARRMDELVAAE